MLSPTKHTSTILAAFQLLVLTMAHPLSLPKQCTSGLMVTPSFGLSGSVFTICANLTISASPKKIYDVLADFESYHLWNSFVYDVDLLEPVAVGSQMLFYTTGLIPLVNTTSTERVTFLERNAKVPFIAWRSDIPNSTFEAEHPNNLVDLGGGKTRYVSWETYYGAGSLAVLPLKGNLQRQFEIQGVDLKRRVESLG